LRKGLLTTFCQQILFVDGAGGVPATRTPERPPCHGALLLYLRDEQRADLGRVVDVRAAARLQIDTIDLDEAHAAGAAGRLHAHAAHQLRVRIELGVGDPAGGDRRGCGDQLGQALVQRLLVEQLVHVEVEPRVLRGDRAAVHRMRHQRTQQVRAGMEAPVRLAARDVDARADGHAGCQCGRIGRLGQQVQDLPRLRALARVDHRQRSPVGQLQHAGVAGLPSALRVEHRAVQLHRATVDRGDDRRAPGEVGIVTEQFNGGGGRHRRVNVLR
jgi:hypothetical protein